MHENPEILADPIWTIILYVLIGVITGIVSIFTIYQTYLKYPPIVRRIRKLKKKIRKGRKIKPKITDKRGDIIERRVKETQDILKWGIKAGEEKKISEKSDLIKREQENLKNKGGFQ